MLVHFMLLMFYIIHGGTCLEGLNVCEDRRTKTEYCCAGYEDKHGTCIDIQTIRHDECNNGFTSINGHSCSPCNNNRFGKRCLSRCNCQSVKERCDNVAGCVPKTEVSEEVVHTTKTLERGFPGTLREDDALSTQVKENMLSEAVTKHEESVAETTNTKDDRLFMTSRDIDFSYTLSENTDNSVRTHEKGLPYTQTETIAFPTRTTEESVAVTQNVLKLKWFVYCGGITGVILMIVLLCCAFVQFRKRRQTSNTDINNDENRVLRASGKGNQYASAQKKSMHIYHTIDDNILGGQSANCYVSSEVMIDPSSRKVKTSGATSSYTQHAQQYQCLVPATMEMHVIQVEKYKLECNYIGNKEYIIRLMVVCTR